MKTIQKTAAAALTVMALGTTAQTNWKVDASHSKLGFSVTHLMVSETEGKFKVYEGTVASKSETDFTDAKIEFSVDVNSINTDDEKRDGHLKGEDFFDVRKYNQISFTSSNIEKPDSKGVHELWGELTMKGITKQIKLNIENS